MTSAPRLCLPASRVRELVVLALVVALALPAAAALAQDVDDETVEDVDARVGQLRGDLDAATGAYERTVARMAATEQELVELRAQTAQLEADIAEVDAALSERARSLFMHGGAPVITTLLSSEGPQGAVERASLMATINTREDSRVQAAQALHLRLAQTRRLAADRAAQLETLEADLADRQSALEVSLADAEQLATRLRAIEGRRRHIDRGPQQGIYACIFDRGASHFVDSWGFARSGGRGHQGTDVMAAYGAPVHAFTAGTIQRTSSSSLGGLGLYLWGDDGNLYYYAHLSAVADGARVGTRVLAGEVIAYNGSSGNASGGAPHVHLELHPGGGGAVNPYSWLAAACF